MAKKPKGAKRQKAKQRLEAKTVSLGRHKTNCTICAHEKCAEIEMEFVNWKSPVLIATEYGLADRTSVYRHAHALGLMDKRRRNVRAALERMIEKSGDVDVTASAIVAAIQAYAKVNAQGQWVDRSEHVNLNELFERMTCEELETYAREGALPDWFSQAVSATPYDSQEVKNDDYGAKTAESARYRFDPKTGRLSAGQSAVTHGFACNGGADGARFKGR